MNGSGRTQADTQGGHTGRHSGFGGPARPSGAVRTGGGGTVDEGTANAKHELGQSCASKCGEDEGGATRWRAPGAQRRQRKAHGITTEITRLLREGRVVKILERYPSSLRVSSWTRPTARLSAEISIRVPRFRCGRVGIARGVRTASACGHVNGEDR